MDRNDLLSRHNSPNVPLPWQCQPPTPYDLSIKLEFMLFLQDNFLPKSLYDQNMRWARKAVQAGYQFHSRKAKTQRRRLDTCFPPSLLHSGPFLFLKQFSVKEVYLKQQSSDALVL